MVELTHLQPLAGGWSGRTYLGEVGDDRVVVRIFPPHEAEQAVEVQAALLRLVRGLIPVPEVLEVRRPDRAADAPGLLVTEHLAGERGDVVLAGLDSAGRASLAARIGEIAATLGGMPTVRAGQFVDSDLALVDFALADGLVEWVGDHRVTGLDSGERANLSALAADAQVLLDTAQRTCLVHSDLNPKNLLVDPATLDITGLVDWEFAHSGHPATDLGNALRFERWPEWQDALLSAYCGIRGGQPAVVLAQARAADLWALVDLADRASAHPGINPVADSALELVRGIARSGDLGWTPDPRRA